MPYVVAADRQTGVRNGGLLPFQLSTDFINNYRRLYGPVQLTSLTAEVASKVPRSSPVEPKHFKGNTSLYIYAIFGKLIKLSTGVTHQTTRVQWPSFIYCSDFDQYIT